MSGEQLSFSFNVPAGDGPGGVNTRGLPELTARLRRLAARGVYVGTSSWKYEGWLGRLYHADRYTTRGKFSRKKFNEQCLTEYAAVFPTVCGDFAFYQFPSLQMWRQLFAQVPEGFRFSLKVPEEVTVERWPDLPRYGHRAGNLNPHFMDPLLVEEQLLRALDHFRSRLGVLVLEFGTIRDGPHCEPRQFVQRLDQMLGALPTSRFQFSVEVRNPDFLNAASGYFDCLRGHEVAHCFNSWTRMPPVNDQLALPGALTAAHAAARFLLPPGRTYAHAVAALAPYQQIQEPYPAGRDALTRLIRLALDTGKKLYIFVNNRFEGNAIQTIEASIAELA